jgi:galactofuranosylgalactofuranosylrhamnosyl-N-acetylglucosaminyl-diphospho-decaprenol beta-1,5/1,6-galactofuranosyltransferase
MTSLVAHEIVCPPASDPEIVPLYVTAVTGVLTSADGAATEVELLDRHTFRVAAGSTSSTGAYFNAFPVAYWVRWTAITALALVVRYRGRSGRLTVYGSDCHGVVSCRASMALDSAEGDHGEVVVDLGLSGFDDGGWYWFDVAAHDEPVTIVHASYVAETPRADATTVTLAITTFNRPAWCTALLAQLASAPDDVAAVDEILVIDQGSQPVDEAPGYDAVAARLSPRLRVVRQGNLGGSGGFARGMVETLLAGRSTHVLLLDDDVSLETSGIARALAFAAACEQPTIVGGQMLSSMRRTRLHSLGEVVDPDRFWWTAAPFVEPDHDLAERSLPQTAWMHRRVDVDYNGWWMCLVPVSVIREIGLPLPAFIKWDDAEYGLRAQTHGTPTVSLPGVAVWHVPWSVKDDAVDWQAYFHQRNRLVAALLNVDRRRSGAVLRHSLAHQAAFILGMQYSTAALRTAAIDDVISGPAHMHEQLPDALDRVRLLRAGYDDADVRTALSDFPTPAKPTAGGVAEVPPRSGREKALLAARGALHQLRRVPEPSRNRPDVALAEGESYWWRLAGLDSAVAPTRDGRSAVWYRRDRATAGRLLWDAVVAHSRLWRDWSGLAAAYQDGRSELVAPQAWQRSFGRAGR